MLDRKFKTTETKTGTRTKTVRKEGSEGTGVVLRYHCGFCKDKGNVVAAFRSQKERNEHTSLCAR